MEPVAILLPIKKDPLLPKLCVQPSTSHNEKSIAMPTECADSISTKTALEMEKSREKEVTQQGATFKNHDVQNSHNSTDHVKQTV